MEFKQVYGIMNTVTTEILGDSAIVTEDLSNIVDIGNTIQNTQGLDKYVKSLVDHIGKVVFVNRSYAGAAPSVLMDGWEFGSILEKVTYDGLPEATENESWDLVDGQSYDPKYLHSLQFLQNSFRNVPLLKFQCLLLKDKLKVLLVQHLNLMDFSA